MNSFKEAIYMSLGKEKVIPVNRSVTEQRRNERFPLTTLVEALEPNSNAQISGRSSDVSLGGCYVDTISPFPEGTAIRIRLTRESKSFEANAKVTYSQIGMGMGIAFTSAEKDQYLIFEKWINEISGKLPPESKVLKQIQANGVDAVLHEEQYYVLNDLVVSLTRKGVLTEVEGKAMLKRLHG